MQIKFDVPCGEWETVEALLSGCDFSHDGGRIGFRAYTVTGNDQSISEAKRKIDAWALDYLSREAW